MEPHHHVHISTGFLFVLMLALVALIVAVGFAIYLARKPKVIERVERVSQTRFIEPEAEERPYVRSVTGVAAVNPNNSGLRNCAYDPEYTARNNSQRAAAPPYIQTAGHMQAAPYTPPVQNDRLFEGILLGELMGSSHGSTTVIESAPSYQPSSDNFSSSSDSGGFSYDSGSSSSDSGGFDCSW